MNDTLKEKENAKSNLDRIAFDKVLKICLIAGIVIVSGFIIFYILNPEPGYVVFGLLNENQEAGDYTTNATVKEDIEFYALVENHLGDDLTFYLKIYKGDNQTQLSPSGSENAILNQTTPEVTIANEEKWISDKLTISFLQIGSNQTIIVELWRNTSDSSDSFYDIQWMRLNITA